MKVLHVIDKSFVGGGQVNVRNLLEGLRERGVEPVLACRAGGPLVAWVEALGVRVHGVPFDKRFRPGPARAVARLARAEGAAIVHAHGLVAAFYCVLARRFAGLRAPLLYHQHGFHHHNYGTATIGLRKAAERFVCRNVERVIASSEEDRDALVEGGYAPAARVPVLPNGIPEPIPSAAETAQVKDAPFARERGPWVGIVARLHPQKGIETFLEAAVRVREAVPAARFAVVGSGEIEAALHARARTLPLADALVFTGSLPSRACHPFFDVAVLCSRWEGLPITLLEYMASRRAIVCTDLRGCVEALGPEAAEIVPVDDAPALAAAIVRLLCDPALAARRAATARRRFEERFTLAGVAARYRALYQEVAR